MESKNSIQEKMYLEMQEKSIFDQVQSYAYQYLDMPLSAMYIQRKQP